MANDSDLYNRWQAAQDYATRVLIAAVDGAPRRQAAAPSPAHSWRRSASRSAIANLEPGYRAQFMLLPSENDIARIIGRDVDPLAIHKARNDAAQGDRHAALRRPWLDIYRAVRAQGPLLAGAGGRRQAGAAQRGAGLPGGPRAGRGHRPVGRPLRRGPQRHRRGERAGHAGGAALARSGTRPSSASTSAGRATTSSSTTGSPTRRPPRCRRRWRP